MRVDRPMDNALSVDICDMYVFMPGCPERATHARMCVYLCTCKLCIYLCVYMYVYTYTYVYICIYIQLSEEEFRHVVSNSFPAA